MARGQSKRCPCPLSQRRFKKTLMVVGFALYVIVCVHFIAIVKLRTQGAPRDLSPEQIPNIAPNEPQDSSSDTVLKRLVEQYKVPVMDQHVQPERLRDVWKMADAWANDRQLFPTDTTLLGTALKAMATAAIEAVEEGPGGSGLKLLLTLTGGQKALFKPKWYDRDYVWPTSNLCQMKDTHNGEIATFHLARLLEMRATPLTVGRRVNLKKEIIPLASADLLETFYTNDDNMTCVYGTCVVCHRKHSACSTRDGDKDEEGQKEEKGEGLEGVMILWLPSHMHVRQTFHPWGDMCPVLLTHRFEYHVQGVNTSKELCRQTPDWGPFLGRPWLFLDLVDSAVLHFLAHNVDRKLFLGSGPYAACMPTLDNGRTFPNPDMPDTVEILAPLSDCCVIRQSTHQRLLLLEQGPLSEVMKGVTQGDPLYPLLSTPRLQALDRRLTFTLAVIDTCIMLHGRDYVLVSDDRTVSHMDEE